MKKELMANHTGFLALQDPNLREVMSEEMDGLSAAFERTSPLAASLTAAAVFRFLDC